MNAADWRRVLARRWRLVVPLLLLVVIGTAFVGQKVPGEYTATGTVLLLQPAQNPGEPENPFLFFGGNLPVVGGIASRTMAGDEAVRAIADAGGTGAVIVAADRGPMMTVVATAESPVEAKRTLDVANTQLALTLQQLQRDVLAPEPTWVRTQVVASVVETSPSRSNQMRAMVMFLGAGIAFTLAVTLAVELYGRKRANQRRIDSDPMDPRHDLLPLSRDVP